MRYLPFCFLSCTRQSFDVTVRFRIALQTSANVPDFHYDGFYRINTIRRTKRNKKWGGGKETHAGIVLKGVQGLFCMALLLLTADKGTEQS